MAPTPRPAIDRFNEKYEVAPNGCWVWTACLSDTGYGRFGVLGESPRQAHRFSYEYHVGPIPDGLVLDHLCRNRACVNPKHLEPCTLGENTLRSPIALSAINARKEFCLRGHPLSGENLVRQGNTRSCKECLRKKSKAYQERERERLRFMRPLVRGQYDGELYTVQVKAKALQMLTRELSPKDKSKYLWDFTSFHRPLADQGDVIEVMDTDGSVHWVEHATLGDMQTFTCLSHGNCFATYHAAKALQCRPDRKYGPSLKAVK